MKLSNPLGGAIMILGVASGILGGSIAVQFVRSVWVLIIVEFVLWAAFLFLASLALRIGKSIVVKKHGATPAGQGIWYKWWVPGYMILGIVVGIAALEWLRNSIRPGHAFMGLITIYIISGEAIILSVLVVRSIRSE